MSFTVKNCRISIDYSFILVLSFCALISAKNILYMLLFSTIHELSHLLLLSLVGGRPDSLKFSFYGMALKYSCKLSRVRELAVIIAGPLANLLLYILLRDDVNLILFLLNIVPVYPLDGGRILDLFSYRVSSLFSKIFIVALVLVSLLLIVFYNSFSLLFITVYLIFYSVNY